MSKKLIGEKFTESARNSSMFFIPQSWVNAKTERWTILRDGSIDCLTEM